MILVVEDSADQQRLIKQMLTSAGYKDVHLTDSVPEALRILKEQPASVELALVDFMLSSGDGIDLIREARRMPDLRDTPFLLVTGRAGPEIIPQALEAGAADFIFKPFHWMELVSRVRNALRLRMKISRRIAREAELITSQRELEEAFTALALGLTGCWLTFTPPLNLNLWLLSLQALKYIAQSFRRYCPVLKRLSTMNCTASVCSSTELTSYSSVVSLLAKRSRLLLKLTFKSIVVAAWGTTLFAVKGKKLRVIAEDENALSWVIEAMFERPPQICSETVAFINNDGIKL